MWKDFKKAFPLGLDKNGNPKKAESARSLPHCPECKEGIELAGMLPTECG